MLQLNSISLFQFRNYLQKNFSFTERIIGIYGSNGVGKTNLLDAIYYLALTKSYFSRTDAQNMQHGLQGLRIEGNYLLKNKAEKIVCIVRENNKKEFSLNDELYKKFSEHIGKFTCVMIAPDDVELITGSSEERRKFIDTILSQINQDYLRQLIDYNKILQQRNSLLKQIAEHGNADNILLETLSEQLSIKGEYIFLQRNIFLQKFIRLAQSFYEKISGTNDNIQLQYESQLLNGRMKELLKLNTQKDLLLQRTGIGIHKDDIDIEMNNFSFKSEASQGQKKTLLFALKLAEWQTLKTAKNFSPILLLDDVFEKLDEQRMHNLLNWVCTEDDGQVFITDTHKNRLQQQLQAIQINFQLIELK
jgi:DNA replication and repair protein RecF